jgi:hypothetical protein
MDALLRKQMGRGCGTQKPEGGGEKNTKATISIHCEPSASIGSTRV